MPVTRVQMVRCAMSKDPRLQTGWPRTHTVWRGAILHSIVNATMVAENPFFRRFLFWDGNNYVLNGANGTYATVAFGGPTGPLVAVFFDVHSRLNPMPFGSSCDVEPFFKGMPPLQRSIAFDRALLYNRQDVDGRAVPVVTAAFWDNGEFLTGAFTWKEIFDNGAHVIEVELMDPQIGICELEDGYEMTKKQVEFACTVFKRRMACSGEGIDLSRSDVDWLQGLSSDPEAIVSCRDAFAAINIRV